MSLIQWIGIGVLVLAFAAFGWALCRAAGEADVAQQSRDDAARWRRP